MAAKAGRLQIQLEMQVAKLQSDLDKANRAIENSALKWAKTFATVGAAFAGGFVAGAVMEGIRTLNDQLGQVMERVDAIADGAKRVGLSAEQFQELGYAAEQSGLSMADLEKSLVKMQRGFGDASEGFKQALRDIGLSFDDLAGKTDKEQFIAIVDALGKVESNATRASAGAALLGKGFAALGPLMAEGAAGIEEMIDKAHRLGIILSDEVVEAGEAFNDQMDTAKLVVQGLISQALEPLLPQLVAISEAFLDLYGDSNKASDGVSAFKGAADSIADTLVKATSYIRLFANEAELAGGVLEEFWKSLKHEQEEGFIGFGKNIRRLLEEHRKGAEQIARDEFAVMKRLQAARNSIVVPTSYVNFENGKFVDATARRSTDDDTESTNRNTEAKRANTVARKENVEEKQKEVDLDKLLSGMQSKFEESFARTSELKSQQVEAQMRLNHESENAIEIKRAEMAGYSEKQIAILKDIQAMEAQTKAQEEQTAATERQQQALLQTLDAGFNDIFASMTEGADQAKEAVARLITQLLAAFITAKALQALGLPSTGGLFQNARGNVYGPGGLMAFGQGGVVYGATPFTFGGGRRGVMGEAGPEGIFPLARDSAGRLGVRGSGGNVKVSVHNYGGAQVGVEQRGDDIRVIVDQVRGVLSNDVARGGNAFAGALEGAYRLRR